ncbi:hypothetical protein D3C87_162600 [compost metagenome]
MDQERERSTPVPEFTQYSKGQPTENSMDEAEILGDQDQTTPPKRNRRRRDDENMGAKSLSYDSLEDEPGDFMRGEIDVKEQMDRAADAMDASLKGLQNQGAEDSPQTELGASFKYTPGGIEEVAEKTDEYLATHNLSPKKHRRHKEHRTQK